jgi:hypothetical protein
MVVINDDRATGTIKNHATPTRRRRQTRPGKHPSYIPTPLDQAAVVPPAKTHVKKINQLSNSRNTQICRSIAIRLPIDSTRACLK